MGERNEDGTFGKKYSEKQLVDELRKADATVEGNLTKYEYEQMNTISSTAITNRFGSWNNAKEIAGINKNEFKSVELKCDNCGSKFERWKSNVKEYYEKSFCDKDCEAEYFSGENSPFWKGGYQGHYGWNWKKQREKALKRDNHKCQKCGIPEEKSEWPLEVHHKIPFRKFEDCEEANRTSNLITYCKKCHSMVERNGGT